MAVKLIKPTEDERKNGWTSETLTRYMKERELEQAHQVLYRKEEPPAFQNSRYNPHKWRR